MTVPRACVMITVVWVSSTLICIPPLFGWRNEQPTHNQCQLTSGKGYVIYSASGSFFIPTIIMVCFYAQIYRVAIRQQKMIEKTGSLGTFRDLNDSTSPTSPDNQTLTSVDLQCTEKIRKQNTSRSSSKDFTQKKHSTKFAKEKKASKTLAIVMGCFIMCWLPFFSLYTIRGICEDDSIINQHIFDVFFWLGYCNSAFNPIIYTLTNRAFKRALWKIKHRIGCISMSLR